MLLFELICGVVYQDFTYGLMFLGNRISVKTNKLIRDYCLNRMPSPIYAFGTNCTDMQSYHIPVALSIVVQISMIILGNVSAWFLLSVWYASDATLIPNLTLLCSRSQMTNTVVMDLPYAGNYHTDRQSSTYRSKV